MSSATFQPQKLFTVDQANRVLPLVRMIVRDLAELSTQVAERRQRLSHLTSGREPASGDPYAEELLEVQRQLGRDAARIDEYVGELRQLGVEPTNGPQGIVDFPAKIDNRLVYLCWKYDEPTIGYWHEIDAGFSARQPLPAGVLSEHKSGSSVLDN